MEPSNEHTPAVPDLAALDEQLRVDATTWAASSSGTPSAESAAALDLALRDLPARDPAGPTLWHWVPRLVGAIALTAGLAWAVIAAMETDTAHPQNRVAIDRDTEGQGPVGATPPIPARFAPLRDLGSKPTRWLGRELGALTQDAFRVADDLHNRLPRSVRRVLAARTPD